MNIAVLSAGVVTIIWVLAILFIVLIVVRASRNQPVRNMITTALILILAALVLTSLNAGLVFVEPPDRGVVISAFAPGGVRDQALTPGLRWVIPFAENVVMYTISKQTYTMSVAPSEGQVQGDDSIQARTSDGQQIMIDASVIYAINPARVVEVHIAWQNRYDRDLVRAQARGIIRDVVSQFNVEEVVSSKRFEMATQVREVMSQKLDENGLILIDFVLRNISFSPEYAASVEQKQIAEQQAQQAKLVVESKKQEAEQARQVAQGKADAAVIEAEGAAKARVVNAQAEAQALDLLSEALKDKPELLTYQYINKLTPSIQTMLLPSNSPFLFPLPQMSSTQQPASTPVP